MKKKVEKVTKESKMLKPHPKPGLHYKDEKERRQTLNVDSFLKASTIKPIYIENNYRFLSLSPDEIDDLSWLKPISEGKTCCYNAPREVPPNKAQPTDHISENGLKEKQPDSECSFTAEQFREQLSRGDYVAKYATIPLIDMKYAEEKRKKEYKFSQNYNIIKFVHVAGFHLEGKSGVGLNSCVKLFSWNGSPTTEPIHLDFSGDETKTTTFSQAHNDFYMPYANTPKSRFVAVLYSVETNDNNKDKIEKPIAVGHILFSDIKNVGDIQLNWVVFQSGWSLEDHFKSDANFPQFNLVFSVEPDFKVPISKNISQLCLKMTASELLYPSPYLTFYNLHLQLKSDSLPKSSQLFCQITLKTDEENPKVLPFAARSSLSVFLDSFRTSCVLPRDTTHFPDQLQFKINPRSEIESMVAYVEIFQLVNNKTKSIYETHFKIEKAKDDVQIKIKSKSLFGSTTCLFSVSYMYPVIVSPPYSLKLSLLSPPKSINHTSSLQGQSLNQNLPKYSHPMFQDVAPYILQYLFDPLILPSVDFRQFSDILAHCEASWLYQWIENGFYCDSSFPDLFISLLHQNLKKIETCPKPYFLILFKAIVTLRKPYQEKITELILNIASDNYSLPIKVAAVEFIRQSRMFYHTMFLGKPVYQFISRLNTPERLIMFQVLFADPAVIQTVVPPFINAKNQPRVFSPFIPLLSLLFSTINDTFLANNKAAIAPSIKTIGILSVSLEGYCERETAENVAFYLFPLLTLIFTFYDSLIPHIGNDPALVPFMLFILHHCHSDQFIQYFNLLSEYNKLRFYDLCGTFTDENTIKSLAPRIEGIQGNELAVSYEITWRLMIFLRFIEDVENVQDEQLRSIFQIIFHMTSPKQDSEAFPMIFASFGSIVNKFQDEIFKNQTNHIMYIMSNVVSIAQRKLAAARLTAFAFLKYLVELELSRKTKGKPMRCFISLHYSFVKTLFENKDILFRAVDVFSQFTPIDEMINSLKTSWLTSPIYFKRIIDLLNSYQMVQTVKGAAYLQYKEMVNINTQNNDYCAAFICQWRLCALIAEVFKLRKQVVDGIPPEGAAAFPYIPSDFFKELPSLPESGYLLLEGDMFNEKTIADELITALDLCKKAGLHWLAGSITEFLLDFLEAHRLFDSLQSVFQTISQSYTVLAQNDIPALEFYLVLFRGPISSKLTRKDTIQLLAQGTLENYKKMLKEAEPGIIFEGDEKELFFTRKEKPPKDQSVCQIIQVRYVLNELIDLNAKTFMLDLPQEEKGWKDIFDIQYVFKINGSLPGPVSNIEIDKDIHTYKITKQQFYLDELKSYYDQVSEKITEFRKVMPPTKLETQWTKWSLGLNTDSLLEKIKLTLDDNFNIDPTNPKKPTTPLKFVKKYMVAKTTKSKPPDDKLFGFDLMDKESADLLKEFAQMIWNLLSDAIDVIDDLFKLNNRDRMQEDVIGDPKMDAYREIIHPSSQQIKDIV